VIYANILGWANRPKAEAAANKGRAVVKGVKDNNKLFSK